MPRFRVGDSVTVKDSSPDLGSHTGKIIDVSYLSEDLMPCGDPRVYVLQFEDGSERRFRGDEIELE